MSTTLKIEKVYNGFIITEEHGMSLDIRKVCETLEEALTLVRSNYELLK